MTIGNICFFFAVVLGVTSASAQSFSVPAIRNEANKVATAISVPQRALVTVNVTGNISLGPGRPCTPNGILGSTSRPMGMTFGVPVVVIRGNHYSIEGGNRSFVAPHSGTISLYIADTSPGDNSGSYSFNIAIGPGIVGDSDEDTLDDGFEDEVLSYFAPNLRFDSSEDVWPSSVQWHARISTIAVYNPNYQELISSESTPPIYPEWHIAMNVGNTPDALSNLLDANSGLDLVPGASRWRMATDNTWRREGEGRPQGGGLNRLTESGLTLVS